MGKKEIVRDFQEFKDNILGILIFGSKADKSHTKRSDIDICLVAGEYNPEKLFKEFLKTPLTEKYDVKIFELLPLKLKGSVLENHQVLWAEDPGELSYYLHKWNRIWMDQKLELKKLGIEIFSSG